MTERDTKRNGALAAPNARYGRLTQVSISAGRPLDICIHKDGYKHVDGDRVRPKSRIA